MAWKYSEAEKEKSKEIFTRREIEKDVRNSYKSHAYWYLALTTIMLSFNVVFVATGIIGFGLDRPPFVSFVVFIIIILFEVLQIALLFVTCYSFYKYKAKLKYQIVSDRYEFYHVKHYYPAGGFSAFHFNTYGDFLPSFSLGVTMKEYEKGFYSWSSKCECGYTGLMQTTYPGDEFYLIIINNRIKYVYNKKLFEFKETEKA